MTPEYFVDYKLSLPNLGTDYVRSHTWDSDSLLVTQNFGLPSYSNHLSAGFVFMLSDEIAVPYDLVAI